MTAQEATRVPRLRQDAVMVHIAAAANAEPNWGVVRGTVLWLDSLVTGNQRDGVAPLELSGCCWVTRSPRCPSPDPRGPPSKCRTVHAVLHLDGGPRGDEFDPDRAQSPASLQHRSDNKYRRRRGGHARGHEVRDVA